MHNIKTNFDKILAVIEDILCNEINADGKYKRPATVPRFSDAEVIARIKDTVFHKKIFLWL